MKKHLKVILLIISVTFLQITTSYSNEDVPVSGISYDEIYDPLEPINRAVLNFNFFIDDVAIRPIIKTYKFIAPEPVEKGVSNFFSNLKEPIRTVSFIFQGEFYKSFNSIGRFTINTITSLGTPTQNYEHRLFNFDGTDKIVITTGTSNPQILNTSFSTSVVDASGTSNFKFVEIFKNHIFFAGHSSNIQEVSFMGP